MAVVSLKCLHQITNKWRNIEWHQGENHDILHNCPAASKKGTSWPRAFQMPVALPDLLVATVRRLGVPTRFLMVLYDSSKYPAAMIQLEENKNKTGVYVLLFSPGLSRARSPCASSSCAPHSLPMPYQPSHSSQKSQGGICSSWEVMGNF